MYTLFGYIISICLLIHLSIVTCYIEGKERRIPSTQIHHHGNKAKVTSGGDAIISLQRKFEISKNTERTKKHFFSRHNNDFLIRRQHVYRSQHKRHKKDDSKDSTIYASEETSCKFPFIYDGVTRYNCIESPSISNLTWCSLTSNYDRDTKWKHCEPNTRNAGKRSDKLKYKMIENKIKKRWKGMMCIIKPDLACNSTDNDIVRYSNHSLNGTLQYNNEIEGKIANNETQNSSISISNNNETNDNLNFTMIEKLGNQSIDSNATRKSKCIYNENCQKNYDDVSSETDGDIRVTPILFRKHEPTKGSLLDVGTKNNTKDEVSPPQLKNVTSVKNESTFIGEKELLNDDEKNMVSYVSNSIIHSVEKGKEGDNSTVKDGFSSETYDKSENEKDARVHLPDNQWKTDIISNDTGNNGTQLQTGIPGAKNINIIIINNRNDSLDLDDIENTFTRTNDPSQNQNQTNIFDKSNASMEVLNDKTNTSDVGLDGTNPDMPHYMIHTDSNVNESRVMVDDLGETQPASDYIAPIIGPISSYTQNESQHNNDRETTSNDTEEAEDNAHEKIYAIKNSDNTSQDLKKKLILAEKNVPVSPEPVKPLTELEIEQKFNESRQYLQQANNSPDKVLKPSALLTKHEENFIVKSSPPSLRKSGLVSMNYAPEEIEIATYGGNANGEKCMFPFIFDGDSYFNCINTNRGKTWCSVTGNYDKTPKWGYCSEEQLAVDEVQKMDGVLHHNNHSQKTQQLVNKMHNQGEEFISEHSGIKTFGGNASGEPCTIPFVYDGQTYMKCIPKEDGTSWCATQRNYDVHPKWGYCCEGDDKCVV